MCSVALFIFLLEPEQDMCLEVFRLWLSVATWGRLARNPSLRLALERRHLLLELLHLAFQGDTPAPHEIGHGAGEARIADPMGAVGRRWQVSALNLVRPLGSGLDPLQPARDGEIDGAVVARLEMEEREIAGAAPIAAIERVAAEQVEGAGDVAPALPGHDQHDAVGHALADEIEEGAGEVGVAPFAVGG